MSNLGNKDVFAKNLIYYIEKSGKSRKELAEIWGFPYSTVSEWTKAKKYPRIDKIEIMANYFGILKSDLIEDKPKAHKEMQKKNDIMTDIVLRMNNDSDFFLLVETLNSLDSDKIRGVKQMLNAFLK
jgi:transcriptional regulator with XRE-family HTH domain